MNKARKSNKLFWRSLWLAALLSLSAGLAYGQDAVPEAITITQVDPSNFPEMVVYIDAAASNLAPGLTQADFAVTEDGEPAEIIDFAGEGESRPVDIVFVFDTTSSMGGEIDGVIRSSIAFAEQLSANNRDFRLGLVAFGDEIRSIANADLTLTADVDEFTGWVRRLSADGGGDDPEASLDGLEQATAMQFRPDAQKVLLLITDAAPHEAGDGTPYSRLTSAGLAQSLHDEGFVVYAVAVDDASYHTVVTETGGKFYELTRSADFTSIIDEIGGDIAKQYRLTYLSPRSSYDGTNRNIVINAAGMSGEQEFLEPHLVNIQSSLPMGIGLLGVLLVALFAPALFVARTARAGMAAGQMPAQEVAAVAASRLPTCGVCGREIRAGARFCAGCGARV